MKFVSVIIPTRNRAAFLEKVFPTYLSQKSLGELIIINDGSTDGTGKLIYQLAKKDERIKYIENIKSVGAPASRNLGVHKALFELIYYGEDDLYLKDNTLSTLINHMDNSNADAISGRRIWIARGETESIAFDRAAKMKGKLVNVDLMTTNCEILTSDDVESELLDASMLIKKYVFTKVQYDPYYKNNAWREETDFQISCREKGFKLVFCPHVATFHLPKLKDKGGNHMSNSIQYELNIFKNDHYFISKHKVYLKYTLGLNLFKHYFLFILNRLFMKNAIPLIVTSKKKIFP